MPVKFKCTLKDGMVVVGPIQGNGGYLGDGATHLLKFERAKIAEDVLSAVIHRITKRGEREACFAVYPNDCAESRGDPVMIPLIGTKFEIFQ